MTLRFRCQIWQRLWQTPLYCSNFYRLLTLYCSNFYRLLTHYCSGVQQSNCPRRWRAFDNRRVLVHTIQFQRVIPNIGKVIQLTKWLTLTKSLKRSEGNGKNVARKPFNLFGSLALSVSEAVTVCWVQLERGVLGCENTGRGNQQVSETKSCRPPSCCASRTRHSMRVRLSCVRACVLGSMERRLI